ncbi:MAG TPA: hypothetical protein VFH45_02470 [Acidimicrobiales bacterium]|nr:hypothetical protein [Acidimicrobiales bacterium]
MMVASAEPADAAAVLRGATVSVDIRRVGRVIAAVGVGSAVAVSAALFYAGARKNDRVTRLHHYGVPVAITVSGCRGLMGGSGSNLAGYECSGSFVLDGHRYDATVPDGNVHATGSQVRAVSLPDDPTVLSTPWAAARRHPSATVYLAPAGLMLVSTAGVAALAASAPARRRRRVALVRAGG